MPLRNKTRHSLTSLSARKSWQNWHKFMGNQRKYLYHLLRCSYVQLKIQRHEQEELTIWQAANCKQKKFLSQYHELEISLNIQIWSSSWSMFTCKFHYSLSLSDEYLLKIKIDCSLSLRFSVYKQVRYFSLILWLLKSLII